VGKMSIEIGNSGLYRDHCLVNEIEILDRVVVLGSLFYC
jgi:hypothetical protein